MKRFFRIFPLVSAVLGLVVMMSSFSKKQEPVSITGRIELYGNEPFSYPCVRTGDGKIYTIEASEEMTSEIMKTADKIMKFTGFIFLPDVDKDYFVHNASENGFFQVESFSVVE